MKNKIFELLKQNQVDFKLDLGGFYDYYIICLHEKILINCKTYHDKNLKAYYSLQIKVVYENFDKNEYNCFSCDVEKCALFFENIMNLLGVFCPYVE